MAYEAVRLMQFVFSMCLVLGAFGGGILLGWHRWGRSERRASQVAAPLAGARGPAALAFDQADGEMDDTVCQCGRRGRSDLFAPEFDTAGFEAGPTETIDLSDHDPVIRGELPRGASARW